MPQIRKRRLAEEHSPPKEGDASGVPVNRDRFGRTINYLRLSVTDRCNLHCCYCMPEEGIAPRRHADILRYEDLLKIARTAAGLGIEKARVTGGEPLVRKGVVDFLRRLSIIPGLNEVSLTTNGLLLAAHAAQLRPAGGWHRQVSLLALESIRKMQALGLQVEPGDFCREPDHRGHRVGRSALAQPPQDWSDPAENQPDRQGMSHPLRYLSPGWRLRNTPGGHFRQSDRGGCRPSRRQRSDRRSRLNTPGGESAGQPEQCLCEP